MRIVLFALAATVALAVIHQTKEEAFERSKVMENLAGLTDLNGPRLTVRRGIRI